MNINNINVNKYPVSQVFDPASKVVFEIPKYQREYTWGMREWEALFDDLTGNEEGYFLGSIICINASTDSINAPKFEVVDGQQRLTTLSLFLAALYKTLTDYKDELDDEQESDRLQLKRMLVLKKSQSIRVVPQVQGANRDDYLGLLAGINIIPKRPVPNWAGLRRIHRAYYYFIKRINESLESEEEKIHALFKLLDKVNTAILVMIEVSNHSDAYTLFESLNNRGTPLTAVDLIKNLLLARLDAAGDESLDYYFTRWTDILTNLGEEYSEQERFFRQNYNAFRKYYNSPFYNGERQYPLGIIATRTTMLDIYEKMISKDPVKALDDLTENSEIYANILLNKTENLNTEQRDSYLDLQRVQGAPSYVLLLYLIKYQEELQLGATEIASVCKLLVSFFVRRNLTDAPPTRDLARMFMAFIEEIEESDYRGGAVYQYLRNKLIAYSATDEQFMKVLHGPVYEENSGATRFILCMMAQRSMTVENKKDLWAKTNNKNYVWSIEHIFPQGENIPDEWVAMIADGDRRKAKEYQAQYVHTFGNLTITGYNSTLSNKAFLDKRDRKNQNGQYIGYRNGLSLNDDVCSRDSWTIEVIQERTERMVKEIIEMFAL